MDAAEPGDSIVVGPGTYHEHVVLSKPLELLGEGFPVIDGGGTGVVLTVEAADTTIKGFEIKGSGSSLNSEDAGISLVDSDRTRIEGNRITGVLFGIYVRNSQDCSIIDNTIVGMDLPMVSRGDGIRLWYSSGTLVEGNHLLNTRDLVIWFSKDTLLTRNRVEGGRYGLHYMYSNDNRFEDNIFIGNLVGGFLMYSKGLTFYRNVFASNRGLASGYGVGFKDLDDVVVGDNLFIDNRIGMYIDNSPTSYGSWNYISGNIITSNDIGLSAMPSIERNVFTSNSFVDNTEQVEVRGGGSLVQNEWHRDGRGNYWSDYVGYDADGDGIGEVPYVSESLFESIIDKYPNLRLFTFSPAAEAIEFASDAIPPLRPEAKLRDDFPLTQPGAMMRFGEGPKGVSRALLLYSFALVAGSLALAILFFRQGRVS